MALPPECRQEPELARATNEGRARAYSRFVTPTEEPPADPDLTELEELERDLAGLEQELEIADASGDEADPPTE